MMVRDFIISRHAYNNGITRFGFEARDIANIFRNGDLLSQEEKELVWLSRPASRNFSDKKTDYYFDYKTAAVVVVVPSPEGKVAVTVYEAEYIKRHRDKDHWTLPEQDRYDPKSHTKATKKAQRRISRQRAEEIWELVRRGALLSINGEPAQLEVYQEGNVVVVKDGKAKLLCRFSEKQIEVREP